MGLTQWVYDALHGTPKIPQCPSEAMLQMRHYPDKSIVTQCIRDDDGHENHWYNNADLSRITWTSDKEIDRS